MPAASNADPMIAMFLYRPVRETACPLTKLPRTAPIISGVRRLPDCVAETPITPCMNSGR